MPELTQKVYTCEDWAETIKAMHSGEAIEVGEDVFDYFLEVLPPVYMGARRIVGNGADRRERRVVFGFAEGAENITAFWMTGGGYDDPGRRFFCQRTAEVHNGR